MAAYLLDTNHLGRCLYPVSHLRERIRFAHRAGHRFGTCTPALCELEIFIAGAPNQEPGHRLLKDLLHFVRVWPLDPPVARFYADIYLDLRRRGRVMSQVDMMLAAFARQKNYTPKTGCGWSLVVRNFLTRTRDATRTSNRPARLSRSPRCPR